MKKEFIFISTLSLSFSLHGMNEEIQIKEAKQFAKFKECFEDHWKGQEITFPFNTQENRDKIKIFTSACRFEALYDEIKKLLEAGLNPDITLPNTPTCLFSAVKANAVNNVKLLLQHDANPNGVKNFPTYQNNYLPLHEAVKNGNLEIIKLLLNNEGKEFKADPNQYDDVSGLTPIMIACSEAGDYYNKEGNCHNGCYTNNHDLRIQVIYTLIKAGANIKPQNFFGHDSITIAKNSNLSELAKYLSYNSK